MKKNGFGLVELLVCLTLLGIVLIFGIVSSRKGLATSLATIRYVSDNEVFSAARNYVIGENISLKKGYTCMYVKDLIDYGYLSAINDPEKENEIIKVSRNKVTKTIDKIKYVDICE